MCCILNHYFKTHQSIIQKIIVFQIYFSIIFKYQTPEIVKTKTVLLTITGLGGIACREKLCSDLGC